MEAGAGPLTCDLRPPSSDTAPRRQAVNPPKKLFTIDHALALAYAPDPMIDRRRKIENVVFHHWRRQRTDLFYWRGQHEVDLCVGDPKPEVLVNVTLSLTQPDAARREFAGLLEVKQRHPSARAVVVAQETTTTVPPPGIEIVPAWRFLLEGASGA